MFIGHYAPAFIAAALPRAPRLAVLFVAAQLVDFAFFGFALVGVEHLRLTPGITTMNAMDLYDMPYTHSLAGAFAFALLWGIATLALTRDRRAAAIGASVVVSHWLLDLLVHQPDLTLAGQGERFGLGLWNRPAIEMPLELGLVAIGIACYMRRTRPTSRSGTLSLAALVVALMIVQAINWAEAQPARVIDPAPASGPILALVVYTALAALAWWVGATRVAKAGPRVRAL